MDHERARRRMVAEHLAARGVNAPAVLEAMETVPRERFVPPELEAHAYDDSPLPIAEGQTISQPYIVGWMAQALEIRPGDRVLEIGAGSGYAAAILGRLAREVYTVERHAPLAEVARERLRALGSENVHVIHGDGSVGLPAQAPFDAILVSAGSPEVPAPLMEQLAPGGRLVVPVGTSPRSQELLRIRRTPSGSFTRERLGSVVFVPLIGAAGWAEPPAARAPRPAGVGALVRECCEPIDRIEDAAVSSLLERIGDARVVLLGEATHGSSEFYRLRTRITMQLITRLGFDIVAIEGDWPDAAQVDRYLHGGTPRSGAGPAFARFPQWMWRNREVLELVEWLRAWQEERRRTDRRITFAGLDLYSMYTSIAEVLAYLGRVDPPAAVAARERYAALMPWEADPALYGRAVLSGRMQAQEGPVLAVLRDLLAQRLEYARGDGAAFFDASSNARLVADAEQYYRAMYYGAHESWNLRDDHMFETLRSLLAFRGPGSRAVVWEHNSHVGDASATEMSLRGETNVGALCRAAFGEAAYSIGFGTDHGTVAAASEWDGPLEIKHVRPAHAASYERVFHDSGVPAFFLPLRDPRRAELREELLVGRLERAIGVIYRPETELQSHYFRAVLPQQFDEWVWFDETAAVTPVGGRDAASWFRHPLAW